MKGIESTLSLLQHELRGRIEVVRDLAELPPIPCYPNRLNQVFMNLFVNAIQAISGKGQIRVQTRLENQQVKIAISDSGSGIKPEHLAKIFDPGFTTKGVGIGTGLGLSISVTDHSRPPGIDLSGKRIGQGNDLSYLASPGRSCRSGTRRISST